MPTSARFAILGIDKSIPYTANKNELFVGSIHESTAINETIKIKSGDHRSPLQIYSHFIFFELSF